MNPLLLLHGALGSFQQMEPLKEALSANFEVYSINFSGHGGTPFPDEPLSTPLFSRQLGQWIDEKGFGQIDIFGYSMGGYVALYHALQHPDQVGKIFTHGTKFDWTEEGARKEVKMLNPEVIKEKVPKFASMLEKRHHPNSWETLLEKTAEMMINLGKSPDLTPETLGTLTQDVRVSVGDKDRTAGVEASYQAFRQIPNAGFQVVPDTPHPFERVSLKRMVNEITSYFLPEGDR